MSGKLIMPKHTGQRTEFEAVLKVHFIKNDWVSSGELKDLLHDEYVRLGKETVRKTDDTDYTKDAQLPRYFGLIERPSGKELKNDAETRITPSGKAFYEALKKDDWETIHRLIVDALSSLTFGRNTQGCGSDSDYEPLGIFFRSAYALTGISNKEYGFLLAELDEKNRSMTAVLDEIKALRESGAAIPVANKSLASNLADAKTLVLLRELKFLSLDGDRNIIATNVDSKYRTILSSLPIFNTAAMKDKYLAAIRTKPFILLAGISGTGKSRMVRQLARGCCPAGSSLVDEQKPGNFEMVQVRPNWHDSTELLGYATRITDDGKPRYVLTDFVRFLAKAWLFPDVPFFLCLDEMNLAPVEQYFAEYLSVVETRKRDAATGAIRTDVLVRFPPETAARAIGELLAPFEPPTPGFAKAEVDALRAAWEADGGLRIPPNLVVMGTVNMDETTFSFSRKVLDRAMSFELSDVKLAEGLDASPETPFGSIPAAAATPSRLKPAEFYAANRALCDAAVAFLGTVNKALERTPFQIAYRTRDEVLLYCVERTEGGASLPQALDEAACMKILSRVEGDQKREGVLKALAEAVRAALDAAGDAARECTACTEKIGEMLAQLKDGGYTSFWTR